MVVWVVGQFAIRKNTEVGHSRFRGNPVTAFSSALIDRGVDPACAGMAQEETDPLPRCDVQNARVVA